MIRLEAGGHSFALATLPFSSMTHVHIGALPVCALDESVPPM